MHNIIPIHHQKRALIALLLIAVLAALFWTQSRYPALDEKAMMSGAIQLEDPISFEVVFPVTPDMPVLQKIAYSTVNWMDTNKKGMTFGILIGAAFLTFLSYLQARSFRSGFLNSALGLVMGAPLGVCVNCAAPIAKGLYSGGMRAETTLSAMIASPTLNAVVISMMISLFPIYMVATKLALSLVVILIAVPLVCRLLPQAQLQTPTLDMPAIEGWDINTPPESWGAAVIGLIRSFGANLWYIIRMTVPLMLLAGALGATVATLLPGYMLIGLSFGLGILLLICVIGLFLPVPIAFDVVVAAALLSAGLAPGYVMALLFTLGIFSIYSFFIVAQSISARAAVLISAVVVLFGVAAGGGAQLYHHWQSKRALDILLSFHVIGAAHAQEADITLTPLPFNARSSAAETPFTRLDGHAIGIDKPIEFSFQDMWPPFWEGRSLSSGDYDGDGDLDLVIASTHKGLYLYDNDGTGQFTRQPLDLGPLADLPVFNAALVDLTGDGWLDLFLTTYQSGNVLLPGGADGFDLTARTPVANGKDVPLTLALAFDDPDQDGDLDIALGNWAAGWYRRVPGDESRNRLIFNNNGVIDGSQFTDLPAIPGETLSILFADINGDGKPDLLAGNDFEIPDAFYLGDGAGGFTQITYQDQTIPKTTTTTMAVKVADLHNDSVPEIYLAQIAGRSSGVSDILKMQPLARYCDSITSTKDKAICEKNMAIKAWYKSGNNFDPTYAGKCQTLTGRDQGECKAMLVKDLAIQQNDGSICKLIPKAQWVARSYCINHFRPIRAVTAAEAEASIPQILRSNVLLERGDGPVFTDRAETQGLDVGGWSWDTKIADFDLDGWQDVYIVNGTWVPNEVSPSNLFFHNQGDGTFVEASGPFGLEDYLMTAAATAFDFDHDGDLDMITHTVNGPIRVFRNNTQSGNSIGFEFRDARGNHFGIGARVVLTMPDGSTQSRVAELGGGFMSFDAPRLIFGLADAPAIASGRVYWADGSVSDFGALDAGALYQVQRD